MTTAVEAIDAAIQEATKARSLVSKIKTKQVSAAEPVALLMSTAHAWFKSHRPAVEAGAPDLDLTVADRYYTTVLNATAKRAARRTYLDALRGAKKAVVALRAEAVVAPTAPSTGSTDDLAPDFSPLVGNPEMRDILTRRWHECRKCVEAGAHLAAIVMMGGLLEALFVARANKIGRAHV